MRVVELGEKKLVGLRVVCPGDQYVREIPKTYADLIDRMHEIKHTVEPIQLIGAYVVGDWSEEEDGYWVCAEVTDYGDIPADMVALTVPPQRYAVIRHRGLNDRIRDTYEVLHQWIEENGYERVLRSWHLEISAAGSGNKKSTEVELDLYDTIK